MFLLLQLLDGRKNPLRTLEVGEGTTLSALRAASVKTLLPTHSEGEPSCASSFYPFRFLHNGVPLNGPGHATVVDLGFRSLDKLDLLSRLVGGGGDGGSTCAESRSCYLEMYAQRKPEKFDPKDAIFARWTCCLLSAEPLSPPCVVDKLGNIMNKEAVIRALQSKSLPGPLRHIRGLRDVMDVKLTQIPSVSDDALVRFQCPISGLELNGNFRFFFMKCCGHTLSHRALKELKSSASCPMCRTPSTPSDRMPINGTDEEVEELRKMMDDERARLKAEKKTKASGSGKGEKALPTVGAVSDSAVAKVTVSADQALMASHVGNSVATKVGGRLKARSELVEGERDAACRVSSVGLGEGLAVQKKKHTLLAAEQGSAKKFKASDHVPAGATKEVYASLFTSSRKEEFKETYSCRSLPLARN